MRWNERGRERDGNERESERVHVLGHAIPLQVQRVSHPDPASYGCLSTASYMYCKRNLLSRQSLLQADIVLPY
jgi:hypothetical protein